MCTVEAVCSCMLFKCCVFIVFLLCCSFLPTNMEFLSHSSFRPFWERWTVIIVLKHHVTVEFWLLNWSICGYDCYSSGKRSGERNFAGSILWKPLTPPGFCGFSNGSLGNICRFIPAAELANAYKQYPKHLITRVKKCIRKCKTWEHYWQKHVADPCLSGFVTLDISIAIWWTCSEPEGLLCLQIFKLLLFFPVSTCISCKSCVTV